MASDKNWVDPTSYEPIKPNDHQEARIKAIRAAARAFAEAMDKALPAGPDKAHTFRHFRTAVMWANYTISRGADDTKDEEP
jgi:hypothetical protein